ncbi:MAG: hypothetical protein VX246_16205 [Myxococcota bacterium]|nr:hypothetical protein [Myxococcota bacterium]
MSDRMASSDAGLLGRLLAMPGCDVPGSIALKSTALRILVPLSLAGELLFEHKIAPRLFVLVLAWASVSTHWKRPASALLLGVQLAVVAVQFPVVANHSYLQLLLLGLCAALDPDDEREQELFVQGARWLVVAVLFWSGAKKLYYGTYFHGEYLAYQVARDARFSDFFGLFAPAEVARLQSYAAAAGTGPYRLGGTSGPLLVALSNGIWIAEMTVPLLLLWHRTRRFAWILGLGLLLGIEFVAREAFFGILFSGALLSFAGPPLIWRALPWISALIAVLVALGFAGYAPEAMS